MRAHLRAHLSKIYRFEIPFFTSVPSKKFSDVPRGGPWPHAPLNTLLSISFTQFDVLDLV